mmetsp:Transcript_64475/g.207658  ORF Transcript_64475/g.207658 Transcript_64475/m.207658 type:complete len:148 (+) Transcript_64475:1-444(+)
MMSFDEEEEEGLGFMKDWYAWLADPTPISAASYVSSMPSSRAMLEGSAELRDLLQQLLAKDPGQRPSAQDFLRHPFLAGAGGGQSLGREAAPSTPHSLGEEPEARDEDARPRAGQRRLAFRCCQAFRFRSAMAPKPQGGPQREIDRE